MIALLLTMTLNPAHAYEEGHRVGGLAPIKGRRAKVIAYNALSDLIHDTKEDCATDPAVRINYPGTFRTIAKKMKEYNDSAADALGINTDEVPEVLVQTEASHQYFSKWNDYSAFEYAKENARANFLALVVDRFGFSHPPISSKLGHLTSCLTVRGFKVNEETLKKVADATEVDPKSQDSQQGK